jgi:ribose/xylose/arabinose/galactoside ABC-type transport system permease subunit
MSTTITAPETGSAHAHPSRWPRLRRHRIPAMLVLVSACVYVATALLTGQRMQLSLAGVMGLLQRTGALGLVALGQNFVILAGSIDLSVAYVVSISAVLGAFLMQGDAGAIPHAVVAVLLVAAAIGAVNGLLVARLRVSPLIATLGVGLILQGVLTVAFSSLQGSGPRRSRRWPTAPWARSRSPCPASRWWRWRQPSCCSAPSPAPTCMR